MTAAPYFHRVPNYCAVWRKLNTVESNTHLLSLLREYLDEETKPEAARKRATQSFNRSRPNPIHADQEVSAMLIPGKDYTPFQSGIWVFGHVASALASKGVITTSAAQKQDVIAQVSDWWVADRHNRKVKGSHFTASFEPTIVKEIHRRKFPIDALLYTCVNQTLAEYTSRFYPGRTLGGVCACHHDTFNPHMHILLHPETDYGQRIRLSDPHKNKLHVEESRFKFLRAAFNDRARELIVSLTSNPEIARPDDREAALQQWLLLSQYAMTRAKKDPENAAKIFEHWLSQTDLRSVIGEAVETVNAEYESLTPSPTRSDVVTAHFDGVRDRWESSRESHRTVSRIAQQNISEVHAQSLYRPLLDRVLPPSPPSEAEYLSFATKGTQLGSVETMAAARQLRKAQSAARQEEVETALSAYRESIVKTNADLDKVILQTGHLIAKVSLFAGVNLRSPPPHARLVAQPECTPISVLQSVQSAEASAERAMASIARAEALRHRPGEPFPEMSILGIPHSPRFRTFRGVDVARQGPTFQ